jgi:hypothetical protein
MGLRVSRCISTLYALQKKLRLVPTTYLPSICKLVSLILKTTCFQGFKILTLLPSFFAKYLSFVALIERNFYLFYTISEEGVEQGAESREQRAESRGARRWHGAWNEEQGEGRRGRRRKHRFCKPKLSSTTIAIAKVVAKAWSWERRAQSVKEKSSQSTMYVSMAHFLTKVLVKKIFFFPE